MCNWECGRFLWPIIVCISYYPREYVSFSVNKGLPWEVYSGLVSSFWPALEHCLTEWSFHVKTCPCQGGHVLNIWSCDLCYLGKRSGYVTDNSPRTFPQLRIGIVHLRVASNVARYSDFSSAWDPGNTLLWRFSRRNVEFSDSMTLVV